LPVSQTGVDDTASRPSSRGRRRSDRTGETGPVVPVPRPLDERHPVRWQRTYSDALLVIDLVCIVVSMVVAYDVRFGASSGAPVGDRPAFLMAAAITAAWILMLRYANCYEPRTYGLGSDEFKAVVVGTLRVFGTIAVVSYIFKLEIARGFVAIAMPIGLVLLLLGRWLARRWLQRQRRAGRFQHRVIVVGDRVRVTALTEQLRSEPHAGYAVVGACLPNASETMRVSDHVPVLGDLNSVSEAVRTAAADTVAISASPDVHSADVRRISWALEGSGVDLIVAPAVTDVAGPRITVRPVAGLPLLHVEEPEFTGGRQLVKTTMDRVGAIGGLILLSPLLIPAAIAVRLTSPGPALFHQVRIGRDGEEFSCLKLRTMYVDAEERLADLLDGNEGDGLLVKIKDDPRITPVGRFLRRTSIDELPQLWNVVRGDMSLVGPRPLAVKDEEFQGDTRRRMLVRPGITGLWQVSGREDQSWEDAVRLDLYYVENWSIALDLLILARTVLHVLRGSGT
jgi:exopolysaccharide biosynthesis polyprenyl glycosylphosphotransferase